MKIRDFKLERYFAKHEFSAKYMLSSSDCDGYSYEYIMSVIPDRERELWEKMKFGYTQSNGSDYLREGISKYYKSPLDNIVVASPGELAFSAMNVLLEPSDHVVVVAPSYQSLYEVVNSIGCEISWWRPSSDNWRFDVEDLAKLVRKDTRLIVINFPHNPTGAYLSRRELDRVVEIARENDSWIYSDEMYHKLVLIGEELPPVSDIYEKGISLWGVSKTFGLPGLRIGWMVCQDRDFLAKLLSYKDYLSICSSAPSEYLSAFALNHSDKFITPNIEKIRHNLSLFTEFAKTTSVFGEIIPPRAGSTAFIKMNIDVTSLEFSDRLVEETGVMTIPAEMFEYEGRYLRIGFGRENMSEVIRVLEKSSLVQV